MTRICILLLFLVVTAAHGQMSATPTQPGAAPLGNGEPILLRNADSLVVTTVDSQSVRQLVGHVHLDQGNVSVFCDHATQNMATNHIVLNGSVRILQGTVTMLMPHGEYDGATGDATGSGGVVIKDRKMTLHAPSGQYNTHSNQADFHGGVEVEDDTIRILADDLRYLRSTQESWLWGQVELYSKVSRSFVLGDSAHNSPATSYSVIRGRPLLVHIDTVQTAAISDSLQPSDSAAITPPQTPLRPVKKSKPKTSTKSASSPKTSSKSAPKSTSPTTSAPSSKAVSSSAAQKVSPPKSARKDTIREMNLHSLQPSVALSTGAKTSSSATTDTGSTQAEQRNTKDEVQSAEHDPLSASPSSSLRMDTLTILADVMESFRAGGEDRYVASRNVEVLRRNLSARAGRCVYNKQAESIDLQQSPELWADSLHLRADSLWLWLPQKKLRSIQAYHSAFLLMADSTLPSRAHQIEAEHISIAIDKDSVRLISAIHDAKSLYFMKDDQGPDGASRTACDSLFIVFDLGELQNIIWRSGVTSEYYPENMVGGGAHSYYLPAYQEPGVRPSKPLIRERLRSSAPKGETMRESTQSGTSGQTGKDATKP